ncbi:MAG: Na+/H+ antiporter [Opitutaceae bacterium]|nr:Na+/H+ antiporter [Opitutaceae bacterium]
MAFFEHALLILLLIAALAVVGRWLPWLMPITYVSGGVVAALLPGFPAVALDPDFFFLCFLPPLLFADGWLMPLREFVRAKLPILTLAIGLVVFTTVAVGLVAWALVPGLPLAMAFALGAIVSPTDAVAVNAITQRLRVPARLSTVLNGESLMNDATGLVGFKFALAAVVAGSFSFAQASGQFLLVAIGGFGVGLAVAYGVGLARDLLRRFRSAEPAVEITLSLMTPFAAYLLAEALGLSAILAVVAAGLYSGWRDPVRMDVETRRSAFTAWELLLFWLNGAAFVLLGLQSPALLAAVRGQFSTLQLIGFTGAVAGTAILARLVWVFAGMYFTRLLSGVCSSETRPATTLVIGWAGMRGTVTLAAALSIPVALPDGAPFPGRDIVIFLAFGVIVVTLLLQGTTLQALIQRLGIREEDTRAREEKLARISAVEAGLKALRALENEETAPDHAAALNQVIGEYEHRLAVLGAEGETRRSAQRRRRAGHRFRGVALQAERAAIDHLWRTDQIDDEVHRPLQQLLDHEETVLRQTTPQGEG